MVLYQQRCVIITHDDTLKRHDAYKQAKLDAITNKENAATAREDNKKRKQDEKEARQEQQEVNKRLKAANDVIKEQEKLAKADEKEVARVAKEKEKADNKKNKAIWCMCCVKEGTKSANEEPMVESCNGDDCRYGQWFHNASLKKNSTWQPKNDWFCPLCTTMTKF